MKIEIDELKSNIANIEEELNKPLFNLENRVSELFNIYAENSTLISITRGSRSFK